MSTYGYLAHHGVKGQKWGVRHYQNPDGSLTAEGKARYGAKDRSNPSIGSYYKDRMDIKKKIFSDSMYQAFKVDGKKHKQTNEEKELLKKVYKEATSNLNKKYKEEYGAKKVLANSALKALGSLTVAAAVLGGATIYNKSKNSSPSNDDIRDTINKSLESLADIEVPDFIEPDYIEPDYVYPDIEKY